MQHLGPAADPASERSHPPSVRDGSLYFFSRTRGGDCPSRPLSDGACLGVRLRLRRVRLFGGALAVALRGRRGCWSAAVCGTDVPSASGPLRLLRRSRQGRAQGGQRPGGQPPRAPGGSPPAAGRPGRAWSLPRTVPGEPTRARPPRSAAAGRLRRPQPRSRHRAPARAGRRSPGTGL